MIYYCVKNKHNDTIDYGNISERTSQDYMRKFHSGDRFEIIKLVRLSSSKVWAILTTGMIIGVISTTLMLVLIALIVGGV